MICPYGREVGDPPDISWCPSGFPGCDCADEFMRSERDAETQSVIDWWNEKRKR